MSTQFNAELQKKRIRLLNGLAKATFDRKISWDDTSENDIFVTQTLTSSVQVMDNTIDAGASPIGGGKCHISVYSNTGGTMDSFSVSSIFLDDNDPMEDAVMNLRGAINASLAKLRSEKLDTVLEEIGA